MEKLMKVVAVNKGTFTTKEGTERRKAELTLAFHETGFNSNGLFIRRQLVVVALFDQDADNFNIEPGNWLVGTISMCARPSTSDPSRMLQSAFLDRYIPVTNWDAM